MRFGFARLKLFGGRKGHLMADFCEAQSINAAFGNLQYSFFTVQDAAGLPIDHDLCSIIEVL